MLADEVVRLANFGRDVTASMSLAAEYDLKKVAHAAVEVANAISAFTDKSPITLEWLCAVSRLKEDYEPGTVIHLYSRCRGHLSVSWYLPYYCNEHGFSDSDIMLRIEDTVVLANRFNKAKFRLLCAGMDIELFEDVPTIFN